MQPHSDRTLDRKCNYTNITYVSLTTLVQDDMHMLTRFSRKPYKRRAPPPPQRRAPERQQAHTKGSKEKESTSFYTDQVVFHESIQHIRLNAKQLLRSG